MKRLMHVATLGIVLFALSPITSASAEKPLGRCVLAGYAIFSPTNLKSLPTQKLGYEFHGSAECETLPAKEVRSGTVLANGEETLSCAGSIAEAEGKGTLTLGGIGFPFGLRFFAGSPGSTQLAVRFADGGLAVGSATFLQSQSEPATQCFGLAGAHELQFKGQAIGEL